MLFVYSIVAMDLAVSCEVPLVLCKFIEADQSNAGADPPSCGITCLYHRAVRPFPRGMRTLVFVCHVHVHVKLLRYFVAPISTHWCPDCAECASLLHHGLYNIGWQFANSILRGQFTAVNALSL